MGNIDVFHGRRGNKHHLKSTATVPGSSSKYNHFNFLCSFSYPSLLSFSVTFSDFFPTKKSSSTCIQYCSTSATPKNQRGGTVKVQNQDSMASIPLGHWCHNSHHDYYNSVSPKMKYLGSFYRFLWR